MAAAAVVALGPGGLRMRYQRLFVLFPLLATCAPGQWLNFSTPGTPCTRDGKPNLSAPTPRALDGKPDLSGVWMHEPTTVAEVKRIFGNTFDAEIQLAPPGMEIGTQHEYAVTTFHDLVAPASAFGSFPPSGFAEADVPLLAPNAGFSR
jgi:hypothetical protein